MAVEWLAAIGALASTIAASSAGALAKTAVTTGVGVVAGPAVGTAAQAFLQSLDLQDGAKDAVKDAFKDAAKTKVDKFTQDLRTRMAGRLPLPRNHDLVIGVRRAHLVAVEKVLRFYEQAEKARPDHERGDTPDNPAFAPNLWDWLSPRLHANKPVDHEAVTESDIQRVLDHMVHPSAVEGFAEVVMRTRAEAERLALNELEDACGEAPSRFLAFFKGPGDEPGWFDMFALYVNEKIKTEERFIFIAAELVDLKRLIEAADGRIREINGGIAGLEVRLERIEGQLRTVGDSTSIIDQRTERIEKAQDAHGAALAELLALARAGVRSNVRPNRASRKRPCGRLWSAWVGRASGVMI